jgi:hypothetical protein
MPKSGGVGEIRIASIHARRDAVRIRASSSPGEPHRYRASNMKLLK